MTIAGDDVLLTLAIKIGELTSRVAVLEKKVAEITDTQKSAIADTIIPSAEELNKAVEAMKEALNQNLGIAQSVLSFDVAEDGSLLPAKEPSPEEHV